MLDNWPVIAPYAVLALAGGLIFCLGAFGRGLPKGLLWWVALAASAVAGLCALGGPQHGIYLGLLDAGLYGRGFVSLISLVTLLTLLFLRSYARVRGFAGDELYGLMLLAALGMILAAAAVNWLALFLGLQLLSICLYVLIAIRRDSELSLEAGLKYFCLGAAAGAAMIFGMALLYTAGGSLDMLSGLKSAITGGHGGLALLGLGLLLCGLAFKVSLTPLHVWTPDVFQGAPAPITAFLAAGSKTAVAAVLIRICAILPHELWTYWMPVLWMLAALTIVVANVSALKERSAKRLLAFSSASQMGYLLMALVGEDTGGLNAALFFLVVYALMDLGVFGLLGQLSPLGLDLDSLDGLRGLARRHPWRSGFLVLCLFSLAGLPPTGGFLGKFMLFSAVVSSGHLALAVLAALAAAAAIYYYFKLAALMYMEAPEKGVAEAASTVTPAESSALAVIALGLLLLGLFPSWLHQVTAAALHTLAR